LLIRSAAGRDLVAGIIPSDIRPKEQNDADSRRRDIKPALHSRRLRVYTDTHDRHAIPPPFVDGILFLPVFLLYFVGARRDWRLRSACREISIKVSIRQESRELRGPEFSPADGVSSRE
jgi:nitrogenase molybdenum-iron protein alpha/beta subunit